MDEADRSPPATPDTRLVALLGDPVGHSLSPRIQNAAFEAAGIDARYVALRCERPDVGVLMGAIGRAGGAGNVTLPHKEEARRAVREVTGAADRTGAVNTFWSQDGRLLGDNTDVEGFLAAARALLGEEPGGRILLLGAGGAARAALVALLSCGVERVEVVNRTPERARRLADDLRDPRIRVGRSPGASGEGWDLVVNATSLGLSDADPLPVDPGVGDIGALLDLVYRPRETTLVRRARALGIPAEDGGVMLVEQGGASFRRWFGKEPPLDVMRAALAGARTGSVG